MNKFFKAVTEAMNDVEGEFTGRPVPFHALGSGLVDKLYDELQAEEPGEFTRREKCPVALHGANQAMVCKLWKASRKKHGLPVNESMLGMFMLVSKEMKLDVLLEQLETQDPAFLISPDHDKFILDENILNQFSKMLKNNGTYIGAALELDDETINPNRQNVLVASKSPITEDIICKALEDLGLDCDKYIIEIPE